MTALKSRSLDDPPLDTSPGAVARRARRAREVAAQRVRRLCAEARALHENRLVICEVGVAASGTGAVLFELRKRRNTDDGWIDLEDTLLCRPRRVGKWCPGPFRAHAKRALKRTAEAAKRGMALRNRMLPAVKRNSVYGSGGVAPATRISRDHARGRNYAHTLLPGLSRVMATKLVKEELSNLAEEVTAGQYGEEELREVVRRLAQFEDCSRS